MRLSLLLSVLLLGWAFVVAEDTSDEAVSNADAVFQACRTGDAQAVAVLIRDNPALVNVASKPVRTIPRSLYHCVLLNILFCRPVSLH